MANPTTVLNPVLAAGVVFARSNVPNAKIHKFWADQKPGQATVCGARLQSNWQVRSKADKLLWEGESIFINLCRTCSERHGK
jgi:hypothetical protein